MEIYAENYEFAAMKSAGISLHRAMLGLSIFIFALSVTTFFFANNVIPWGEYQSRNLRINIAKLTPAMAIAEGQFNEIGEINIKVDKKSGENGNHLTGVTLHKKNKGKNTTVIKAERGELVPGAENENILQLVLFNGNYYNDIIPRKPKKRASKPHAKSSFEKYTMNIDLSVLNQGDITNEGKLTSFRMLKINQLKVVIDSLEKKMYDDSVIDIKNTISSLQVFKAPNSKVDQKILNKNKQLKEVRKEVRKEGIKKFIDPSLPKKNNAKSVTKNKEIKEDKTVFSGDYLKLFTTKEKVDILKFAVASVGSNHRKIEASENTFLRKLEELNDHKMGLQTKFALAFSCFILFFVGAPLGAIIRKGGMGLPMIIAIGLFLTYWFIGIFAQNSAKSGVLPTFIGSWLSTIILLPLGIMLTRNATSDKGVFETDGFYFFFKKTWNMIAPKKGKNKISPIAEEKVVTKITKKIKLEKDELDRLQAKYVKFSTVTFILYALILALFPILKLKTTSALLPMVLIALVLGYIFCYIITFKNYRKITRSNNDNYSKKDEFIDFIFGFTSYILAYFYYKTDIKKLFQQHKTQQNDNS